MNFNQSKKLFLFITKFLRIDPIFSIYAIVVSTVFVSLPLIILYLLLNFENQIKIHNLIINLNVFNISLILGLLITLSILILFYETKNSHIKLSKNLFLFNDFFESNKLKKIQIHILNLKRRFNYLLIPNFILLIIFYLYFYNDFNDHFYIIIIIGILIFLSIYKFIFKLFVIFQIEKGLLPIYISLLKNIMIFILILFYLIFNNLPLVEIIFFFLVFILLVNYMKIHSIIRNKIFN